MLFDHEYWNHGEHGGRVLKKGFEFFDRFSFYVFGSLFAPCPGFPVV